MQLSIIIPTFNDLSLPLAEALAGQAGRIDGLQWELLVGDDGSTDSRVVEQNRAINSLKSCRYLELQHNVGRAAIRNFLAREAQGEWLLCIDGDARIDEEDYLERMLAARQHYDVCYGGYLMMPGPEGNLRWQYERAAAAAYTVEQRQRRPYAAFNISNLLIRRHLLLQYPLDERITRYGFEDVALGRALQRAGIAVGHIAAPVAYYDYETNAQFLQKTEDSMSTLWEQRDTLQGFSRLLDTAQGMPAPLRAIVRVAFTMTKAPIRRKLLSDQPSVRLFNLYKLGCLLQLMHGDKASKHTKNNT